MEYLTSLILDTFLRGTVLAAGFTVGVAAGVCAGCKVFWGRAVSGGNDVSLGSASPSTILSCIGFAVASAGEAAILLDINSIVTGSIIKIFVFFIGRLSFHLAMLLENRWRTSGICIYIRVIFTSDLIISLC